MDLGDVKEPKSRGKKTVEETYRKTDLRSHILAKPDSYVGSTNIKEEKRWLYNSETGLEYREIRYVPAFLEIFDEILVNASDNKQRDPTMKEIRVSVDRTKGKISIRNDGKGIPIAKHSEYDMFVPQLIFGVLLTSSNYDDTEQRVTGGRNGYGAKLTNIYSTEFTVKTFDSERHLCYSQTWRDHMKECEKPIITTAQRGSDYTEICYYPDLSLFRLEDIDDHHLGLLAHRALDIAGCNDGVSVFFNGKRLEATGFKEYVRLHLRALDEYQDLTNVQLDKKFAFTKVNDKVEVAIAKSFNNELCYLTFVNSIHTVSGGTHLENVIKQLIEPIQQQAMTKTKTQIQPAQIRSKMFVFIRSLIVNPNFEGQMKYKLSTAESQIKGSFVLPEPFISSVVKLKELMSDIQQFSVMNNEKLLKAKGGRKTAKLHGIPKLDDAFDAGTSNSAHCTLILTEGNSAQATATFGITVVGRKLYGSFPLRGKLINCKTSSALQISKNEEINNIKKIVGLKHGTNYSLDENFKTLRYGHVMIMADQDPDGSHIKGLVINMFDTYWPQLLTRKGFLVEFITPIVKVELSNARKSLGEYEYYVDHSQPEKRGKGQSKQILSFYSLAEYDKFIGESTNPLTELGQALNRVKMNTKYYKGLGTSTKVEAKGYFSELEKHKKVFVADDEYKENIEKVFGKASIQRKDWIENAINNNVVSNFNVIEIKTENFFDEDEKSTKPSYNNDNYLDSKATDVKISDFVDKELIHFSNLDNVRSIANIVDGLKITQRKILHTLLNHPRGTNMFKTTNQLKVSQLIGLVSEYTNYHYGEASVEDCIVGMAQTFCGANNIPLVLPIGQYGTRHNPDDNASSRYIFTCLNPLLQFILRDDYKLTANPPVTYYVTDSESDATVEMLELYELVPLVLINGTNGIGTGYSSRVLNHSFERVLESIRLRIIDYANRKKVLTKCTSIYKYDGTAIVKNETNERSRASHVLNLDQIKFIENSSYLAPHYNNWNGFYEQKHNGFKLYGNYEIINMFLKDGDGYTKVVDGNLYRAYVSEKEKLENRAAEEQDRAKGRKGTTKTASRTKRPTKADSMLDKSGVTGALRSMDTNNDIIRIIELPVSKYTSSYKEWIETQMEQYKEIKSQEKKKVKEDETKPKRRTKADTTKAKGSAFKGININVIDFTEHYLDDTVDFIITLEKGEIERISSSLNILAGDLANIDKGRERQLILNRQTNYVNYKVLNNLYVEDGLQLIENKKAEIMTMEEVVGETDMEEMSHVVEGDAEEDDMVSPRSPTTFSNSKKATNFDPNRPNFLASYEDYVKRVLTKSLAPTPFDTSYNKHKGGDDSDDNYGDSSEPTDEIMNTQDRETKERNKIERRPFTATFMFDPLIFKNLQLSLHLSTTNMHLWKNGLDVYNTVEEEANSTTPSGQDQKIEIVSPQVKHGSESDGLSLTDDSESEVEATSKNLLQIKEEMVEEKSGGSDNKSQDSLTSTTLTRFEKTSDVIDTCFMARIECYKRRILHFVRKYIVEIERLSNTKNFLLLVLDGVITIATKKQNALGKVAIQLIQNRIVPARADRKRGILKLIDIYGKAMNTAKPKTRVQKKGPTTAHESLKSTLNAMPEELSTTLKSSIESWSKSTFEVLEKYFDFGGSEEKKARGQSKVKVQETLMLPMYSTYLSLPISSLSNESLARTQRAIDVVKNNLKYYCRQGMKVIDPNDRNGCKLISTAIEWESLDSNNVVLSSSDTADLKAIKAGKTVIIGTEEREYMRELFELQQAYWKTVADEEAEGVVDTTNKFVSPNCKLSTLADFWNAVETEAEMMVEGRKEEEARLMELGKKETKKSLSSLTSPGSRTKRVRKVATKTKDGETEKAPKGRATRTTKKQAEEKDGDTKPATRGSRKAATETTAKKSKSAARRKKILEEESSNSEYSIYEDDDGEEDFENDGEGGSESNDSYGTDDSLEDENDNDEVEEKEEKDSDEKMKGKTNSAKTAQKGKNTKSVRKNKPKHEDESETDSDDDDDDDDDESLEEVIEIKPAASKPKLLRKTTAKKQEADEDEDEDEELIDVFTPSPKPSPKAGKRTIRKDKGTPPRKIQPKITEFDDFKSDNPEEIPVSTPVKKTATAARKTTTTKTATKKKTIKKLPTKKVSFKDEDTSSESSEFHDIYEIKKTTKPTKPTTKASTTTAKRGMSLRGKNISFKEFGTPLKSEDSSTDTDSDFE